MNGPLAAEVIEQDIDQLADLIRPYVELDDSKFFSTTEFELGLSNLKTFVRERSESVRRQLDGISPSIGDGSGAGAGGRMCGGR